MPSFGLAILLSAFLLFSLQPLVGKALLPWFGGAPSLWTTCQLFFQVLLLAGYAWAHGLQRLPLRRQVLAHGALWLCALAALTVAALGWSAPLLPDERWRPTDASSPTWRALQLLLLGAGLPTLALAATSPLAQAWFARLRPGESPWRLYALSNVGSLVALLGYPFLVEPWLRLHVQAWAFGAGFALLALALAAAAAPLWSLAAPLPESTPVAPPEPEAPRPWAAWVGLAALPSLMLLAVTNHLCQEIAVVPLLWVLPLALYLLSFILCFDSDRWYSRARFVPALALLLVGAAAMLLFFVPVIARISVFSLLLFVTGMVCHGELAQRRPAPSGLTGYYLAISSGGALGGVCVGLLAPLVFTTFFELDLALGLTALVASWLLMAAARSRGGSPVVARLQVNALVFCLGGLTVAHALKSQLGSVASARSFYGTVRVVRDARGPGGARRTALMHGATVHGFQVPLEAWRGTPTAYFTRHSGIGHALEHQAKRRAGAPARVGVVGLGIGTLAAYSQAGDTLRFYELSPDVVRLAQDQTLFTYLSGAAGTVELVLGDGRLSLERELAASGSGRFDVLVLDAFGSDSVPVHLLTREAFELYVKHLEGPEAILAVNVLNRSLELAPLIFRAADEAGLAAVRVVTTPPGGEDDPLEFPGDWMLLARTPEVLGRLELEGLTRPRPTGELPRLWTDDFSNLAALIKPLGR